MRSVKKLKIFFWKILITLSCSVFTITQVVPINAEFVDVAQSGAFRYMQQFGYSRATSIGYENGNGNINLTIPAQGTSFTITGDGTMFPTTPGGWVVGWHGTSTTQPFYPTGTFNFSNTIEEGLSVPVMSREGGVNESRSIGGFRVRTSLNSDSSIKDCLVISFFCDRDTYPSFGIDGGLQTVWYDTYDGNMMLFTILIYDQTCPAGGSVNSSDLNIYFNTRPSFVIPIYIGQLSLMSDDLKTVANLSNFTFTNRVLEQLQSINQSIVNGTSESNTVSDSLRDTAGNADSSISGLEGLESDLIGDFNSNLVQPDTSFISQLSTTGNWVRTQFDRLVGLNGAFSGALVVGLTVALALVIIGKMRG